jgi:hypothetical protein
MNWDTPESVIEEQLSRDERLLWSGQPPGGFRLSLADVFLIPFSLLWCGFAIFWVVSAYAMGAPLFFVLFGALFVLIGLFLVFGRFFVDSWLRGRTYYGVTNERIIIMSGAFSRQTRSLPLKTLSEINLTEWPNGRGTIVFGPMFPMMQHFVASVPKTGQIGIAALDRIEDAKSVYDLIRKTQKTAE